MTRVTNPYISFAVVNIVVWKVKVFRQEEHVCFSVTYRIF
jgi:hypothetical protein